jgi:Putative zinc-finger
MSHTPDHAELQEILPAAALEMLDPGEAERVLAHVRDCEECAGLLRQYRDAAAVLALQLPARPMSSERASAIRARLLARARSVRAIPITRRASSMIYQWSGWMVAAGLAGILLVHHSIHRPLAYGWLVAAVLGVLVLALGVYGWVQRNRVAELERRDKRVGG